MASINMTREETWVWDHDERGWRDRVRACVYGRARALANKTGQPVAVYTHDGVMVEQLHPEDDA